MSIKWFENLRCTSFGDTTIDWTLMQRHLQILEDLVTDLKQHLSGFLAALYWVSGGKLSTGGWHRLVGTQVGEHYAPRFRGWRPQ